MNPFFEEELLLRFYRGEQIKEEVHKYINELVDKGEYDEVYAMCVCSIDKFSNQYFMETMELLAARSKHGEKWIRDLAELIDQHEIDAFDATYYYHDTNNIILSDGLRVRRIEDGKIKWTSVGISNSGIKDIHITDSIVVGLSYQYGHPDGIWNVFWLDYDSGKLLKGKEIVW